MRNFLVILNVMIVVMIVMAFSNFANASSDELWPETLSGLSKTNFTTLEHHFPNIDQDAAKFKLLEITPYSYDMSFAYYGKDVMLTDIEDGGICEMIVVKLTERLGAISAVESAPPRDCQPAAQPPIDD
jgi:hypothetical protein